MLSETTHILLFILLAIFIGIFIGYFLAKMPTESMDEPEVNSDMHVDPSTGIVSDDSLLNHGKR